MTSYEQIKAKIIATLMGRPAGTEIQPDQQQDYTLNMLDYTRSLELIATSTLMGIAEATTTPLQPDSSKVCYIAGIGQNRTVTFQNFHNQNGTPISITTNDMQGVFVILLWNQEYWSYESFETNIISHADNANFYYSYNIKKTYSSISEMNADKNNPVGLDGKYIKIGDIVTVVNSTTPTENGIYSYQGVTSDFKFQSSLNFQLSQDKGSNPNISISQKKISELFKDSNSQLDFLSLKQNSLIEKQRISKEILESGLESVIRFSSSIEKGKNYYIYIESEYDIDDFTFNSLFNDDTSYIEHFGTFKTVNKRILSIILTCHNNSNRIEIVPSSKGGIINLIFFETNDSSNYINKNITKNDFKNIGLLSQTGNTYSAYTDGRFTDLITIKGDEWLIFNTSIDNRTLPDGNTVGLIILNCLQQVIGYKRGYGIICLKDYQNAASFRLAYSNVTDSGRDINAKVVPFNNIENVISDYASQMIIGEDMINKSFPTNFVNAKSYANNNISFSNGANLVADFIVPNLDQSVTITLSSIPLNTNQREGTRQYLFDVGQYICIGDRQLADIYSVQSYDLMAKTLTIKLIKDNLNLIGGTIMSGDAYNNSQIGLSNKGYYKADIFLLQDMFAYNYNSLPYCGTYDTIHPTDEYYNNITDSIIARIKEKNGGVIPNNIEVWGDSYTFYGQIANRISSITGATVTNHQHAGWATETIVQDWIDNGIDINKFYVFVMSSNNFGNSGASSVTNKIWDKNFKRIMLKSLSRIQNNLKYGNWLLATGHCGSNNLMIHTDILL